MSELFDNPVRSKEVRKDVIAYMYWNGIIQIGQTRYVLYSMTEAIKKWRKGNPKYGTKQ